VIDYSANAGHVASPDNARRFPFYCFGCDHEANVRITPGASKADLGSFSDRCPGGRECLRRIADALDCRPSDLLDTDKVLDCLGSWLRGRTRTNDGEAEPLPSLGHVGGWASRLFTEPEPLAYLTERRGLSLRTLRRFAVGWDGVRRAITLPAFSSDGTIAYVLRRKPHDGAKVVAMRGRPRMPYPDLPAIGPILLVAGELDSLSARQWGLPATTVAGAALPRHTFAAFAGRVVALLFDVNEEDAAERVAAELRAAGSRSWAVRLSRLGLRDKQDLNDYVCGGGSRADLRKLIAQERGRSQ
jgi:hypothetical protein